MARDDTAFSGAPGPQRVALATGGYGRERRMLFLGIHGVLGNRPGWEIVRDGDTALLDFEQVLAARPDAVIGDIESAEQFERLQAAGVRTVVSTEGCGSVGSMAVGAAVTDEEGLARITLEHFEHCYFRHAAYLGGGGRRQGLRARRRAFVRAAQHAGIEMSVLGSPAELAEIEVPLMVVCESNRLAAKAVSVCLAAGRSIPEEVSIIGVGNDEMACVDSPVSVSNIQLQYDLQGKVAAGLLRRLMAGEARSGEALKVPPGAICPRESTSGIAISDAVVAKAIDVIRRAGSGSGGHLNVEVLARRSGVSRRVLERRFREVLDCTPHEAITRDRVARAKQQIRLTTLPITEIANEVGFADVKSLRFHFRRFVGMLPTEFRQQNVPATAVGGGA